MVEPISDPGLSDEPFDRVDSRAADLLPEERVAGSDDPHAQAAEILRDSDIRESDLDAAPDSFVEHRTSEQTVAPPQP
ncbi:hypothetical protein ACNTMW_10505 [Planosporangium sp. 12N6]|uniref:hypothetical protein n=1 Tax=Planosporangium spinosum TaxID=3402278 RepID=UPI003CF59184